MRPASVQLRRGARAARVWLAFLLVSFVLSEIAMAAGPEALAADAPRPELADKLRLFGQFVGDWDMKVTNPRPHGTSPVAPSEWHFGRVDRFA